MSYDIDAIDPQTNETIQFNRPINASGGTYAPGGTTEAWLNMTYNYAGILGEVLPGGIRFLHDKRVADTMSDIAAAIGKLKWDDEPDYWKETSGNVMRALINVFMIGSAALLVCNNATWKIS